MKEKRMYCMPEVERVELDYEISLVLQSAVEEDYNPVEDPEAYAPGYFNNDPFKSNIG